MLPESLTLGQRTLEDVFLELTGRGLDAVTAGTFTPDARAPPRCAARCWRRPAWRRG